ncbi:MAG TPA: FkbM family methyltransferase [Azospirillum sp.]|nr:FkbM family methyltransferase [Azospirillum sp.]
MPRRQWNNRPLRRKVLSYFLSRLAARRPDVYFIQIGAHNGVDGDPIHTLVRRHGWRGILVEPVPYLYEQLRRNYAGVPGLILDPRAVAEDAAPRRLYRLRPNDDGLPDWYDQLGSFDRDVVLKHRDAIPNIEDYLVSDEVPCVTLSGLLAEHGVARLDLLVIDVEGYDYRILRQLDFNRFAPPVIVYEKKHLGDGDLALSLELLRGWGYRVLDCGPDALALLDPPQASGPDGPTDATVIGEMLDEILRYQDLTGQ